jgi:parallel beta-helix repeat protein
MARRPPAAFMSYVHADDKYGRPTEFRQYLSDEVRIQIGEEFPIFQDHDIQWGQNWRERIEESLDEASFLIPIITPSFFNSPYCRSELERFLDREKQLGRNDLILSVYYVNCPFLDDEAKQASDKLAQAIATHQYADWRELRFEPFTAPLVGKTLARLAGQIRNALERVQASQKTSTTTSASGTASRLSRESSPEVSPSTESAPEGVQSTQQPSTRTDPPTHVVDAMYRGDFPTITQAIAAAQPGDRILVRPGLYQEGLVLDKPLEVIGEGDANLIVVQATGKNALLFKTTMGRVMNLTLRQVGGGAWFGVDIVQGRLELEGCDITSQSMSCIAIHGGADPLLRRNRIHDGKQAGVYVYENGQGTLEDNDIFGNAYAGVAIKTGGNPTLRRNRINKNSFEAVWVNEGGAGTIEDNDLRDNTRGAWDVAADSEPKLKRARNQE